MGSSWMTNVLPFWILGVPLVMAIISYMRLHAKRDRSRSDRAQGRQNSGTESRNRPGSTAASTAATQG